MKRWLLSAMSALILILAGVFGHIRVQAQASQPNVMFIIVDDLRPQLGVYGYPQMVTPNMDALANSGMVFDRAYIMQATCAPSRACMMTGLRPDSTGIYDLETPVRKVLPNVLTLPQYFRNNGYETISIGKVYHDVADDPQGWSQTPFRAPEVSAKKGYQTKEAQRIAAANPFGPPYESADVPDNAYADGKDADYAIQVLQKLKQQDKPFFMALGINKPHLPFTAPKKYWDLYSPEDIELSLAATEPEGMSPFSLTTWGELRRWAGMPKGENPMPVAEAKRLIHGYYAATSYADAQIGRVLAELNRLGYSQNTIVVLIGDHGWKLGDHAAWSKHSNFEIDTRVPLIIRTPETMAKSTGTAIRTNTIVESIDLYPTISQLAGLNIPEYTQGLSLVPLLKDPNTEMKGYAISQFPRGPADGGNNFTHRDEYGLTDERLGEGIMGYGLRVEGYRYVEWFSLSGGKLYPVKSVIGVDVPTRELYDYAQDPLETVNVVSDPLHKVIADQLAAKLRVLLGDKVGEVWFAAPERNDKLAGPTPIRIGSLHASYQRVSVELDQREIFAGSTLPSELVLQPAELTAGRHTLTVTVTDQNGAATQQSTEFMVEHVRITGITSSDRLSGQVTLQTDLRVPIDTVKSAVVSLVSVTEGSNSVTTEVYRGASLPTTVSLDTLAFADGAYDIVVQITTHAGINSTATQRVLINNWQVLEDFVLPPAENNWFGVNDQMETKERSQGWQFVGDAANTLFGDADRIMRKGNTDEFLTWQLPGVHDFVFTVYAHNQVLTDLVQVDVSTDGKQWTTVPYSAMAVGKSEANWFKLQVAGVVAAMAVPADYIRLTFKTNGQVDGNTQLGHVVLKGAKF